MFATLAKTEAADADARTGGAGRSTAQKSSVEKKKNKSAAAAVPAPARSSTAASSLFGDDSGDEQVGICFVDSCGSSHGSENRQYIHACMYTYIHCTYAHTFV